MDRELFRIYDSILIDELKPALGCTEPIAIAFASAAARSALGCMPERITVECSGNIVKNVKGVTVPNSNGMKGIEAAAVLGAVGGDESKALEVLSSVTDDDIEMTQRLLSSSMCRTVLAEGVPGLYISVKAEHGGESAEATIIDCHNEICSLKKNGKLLSSRRAGSGGRDEDERKKLELEYRMLSSQIDPHFLYNTFNAIKWMAKIQKADGISEMITSLSRIMKNISKRDENIVTLAEELSFIDDYLVIMKYRYGNTISYYRSVDEGCERIMLPRFCLQPLIENAIFHGIEPKGTGAVAIIAREYDEHYTIMIADNGVGFDPENAEEKKDGMFKNIGLENIRQRLRHTYADDVSFTISSRIGIETRCMIRIRKRERMDELQSHNSR